MSLDLTITFEALFFLFTLGLWVSIILDIIKFVKKSKREKRLKKENTHTHDEVLGLGILLNDEDKSDSQKVKVMKEILNILDN